MPSDSPSQGGRRHFHRGRRGHERRGGERRNQQQPGAQPPAEPTARGEHVDVEQIMRDIRAKIAQRHGVELTDQQVQDLAARRLESILDLRTVKPALLEQLRRAAGARPDTAAAADRVEAPYTFEDTTLYDSPSGVVRFFRKLLNPILKLFFNPNPLIRALNVQARLNAEAVRREAQRDQRQAEWNALHYELLQRVVSEIAKVSLETQSLGLRVESLAGKVDFNERRVRGIEGAVHQSRPSGQRDRDREREPAPPPQVQPQVAAVQSSPEILEAPAAQAVHETGQGDAPRRRRRRRRGRRGAGPGEAMAPGAVITQDVVEGDEIEEGDVEAPEAVTTEGEAVVEPIASAPAEGAAEPVREEPVSAVTPEESVDPLIPDEPAPERGPSES